jgi:hypothetical protein
MSTPVESISTATSMAGPGRLKRHDLPSQGAKAGVDLLLPRPRLAFSFGALDMI